MATTSLNGSSVTFSNSSVAANLAQTVVAGGDGAVSLLSFNVLAASGGGAKATVWSVDDGVKGDDNAAVAIANKAFASYNTDLLWQDRAGLAETTGKGARFWIDATGQIQYDASPIASRIAALGAGEVFTDTIQYTIRLANGTLSVGTLSVNIVGTDDLSVIQAGGDSGAIAEDAAPASISGNLSSTDVDGPDDLWTAATLGGTGHHGTLTLNAAGEWTYLLDNADPAVDALNDGEHLTDIFTVSTADGQSHAVTITINGHTDHVPDANDHDELGAPTDDRIVDRDASSTLYGGAGDDQIFGNNGQDAIYGGSGNDMLQGQAGYDTIYGGSGNDRIFGQFMGDTLVGGLGDDTISTGFGEDRIVYLSAADGADTITDFDPLLDRIDLSLLDASALQPGDQAFGWNGTAAAAQSVWTVYDAAAVNPDGSLGTTIVNIDLSGDVSADFQIRLQGNLALSADDFVL